MAKKNNKEPNDPLDTENKSGAPVPAAQPSVTPQTDDKNNDHDDDEKQKKTEGKKNQPNAPEPAPEDTEKKELGKGGAWLDRSDAMMNAGFEAVKKGAKGPIVKTASKVVGVLATPLTTSVKVIAAPFIKAEEIRKKMSSQGGDLRRNAAAGFGRLLGMSPVADTKQPVTNKDNESLKSLKRKRDEENQKKNKQAESKEPATPTTTPHKKST